MKIASDKCRRCKFLEQDTQAAICSGCLFPPTTLENYEPAGRNNYNRFTAKSIEELAELFSHLCCPNALGGNVICNAENKGCYECWLEYFKQEEKE